MFTYYQVNGTFNFSHYGEALHFARKIGGNLVVKKSWNPLRLVLVLYDAI